MILWLDCDREGEAIAFDVIEQVQSQLKGASRLEVLRAHFSALTKEEITGAMEKLGEPNKNLSDAVRARQEIDLRMGASFTRFQSLSFQHIIGPQSKMLLSYGPC